MNAHSSVIACALVAQENTDVKLKKIIKNPPHLGSRVYDTVEGQSLLLEQQMQFEEMFPYADVADLFQLQKHVGADDELNKSICMSQANILHLESQANEDEVNLRICQLERNDVFLLRR